MRGFANCFVVDGVDGLSMGCQWCRVMGDGGRFGAIVDAIATATPGFVRAMDPLQASLISLERQESRAFPWWRPRLNWG